jgi:hypothetical protein
MFILDTNFTLKGFTDRASAMTSDGVVFVFERRLVLTAPDEVVQAVIAHELAHAIFFIKYISMGLELPDRHLPTPDLHSTFAEYPVESRHEEDLVNEMIAQWGYNDRLLELCEIALEDSPKDVTRYYRTSRRILESRSRIPNCPRRERWPRLLANQSKVPEGHA